MKKSKIKIVSYLVITIVLLFNCFSYATDNSNEPEVLSEAAVLIDANTGMILYGKNENEKMYPASTTKIMTAILTLENCDLDEEVTAHSSALSDIPSGYVTAGILDGEVLTVEELLQVLLVHSANDSANVLAEYVAGSIDDFVIMMNDKAVELGLTNTNFTNPYGLHDENHYTTAYELSLIMQYCMQNETFVEIAGSTSCTIPATNMSEERTYSTSTNLISPSSSSYYSYAIAGKTGYTSAAGSCLVTGASHNDIDLICVILGGYSENNISSRDVDSINLYEYGFENYCLKNLANPGDIITQVKISNATLDTRNLDLTFAESINVLVNIDDENTNYTPEVILNENISAPISEGDVLGKVIYTVDGVEYETELLATHDVETSVVFNYIIEIGGIILLIIILKLIFSSTKKKKVNKKTKYLYK